MEGTVSLGEWFVPPEMALGYTVCPGMPSRHERCPEMPLRQIECPEKTQEELAPVERCVRVETASGSMRGSVGENHRTTPCRSSGSVGEGHRTTAHTMQQNNEAAGAVKVTDDVKTHIIDLVKRKDILWKVKSRGYKLDAEKAAAYLEISNQVNELHSLSLKGEDIQNIFKNLKDSYMRRLKSAKKAMGNTGDGAKSKKREDKFIFADELEFLLENESDLDVNRPLKAAHKDHIQLRALSLSSAVEDDLDDAFNNEIHTPIRKRRREQHSSRADEELASVLRTLAEENKKNKYEHFADEVACCLKTVEDRNPTLALDMKRQIQEYETSTKADHLAASRQSTSSSQERPKDEGIRPILALGASAITLQVVRGIL
ncbi:hypothetical protein QR680_013101 [Steinernema hermaphroditum]|uniref:MADF domain-containing protein n=1 Tax=Steinernema hermaphroditum TaxID=289476 RepID=A0AA39I4D0_9BILA|nr:hypothetical protein QR680_013101 [Steinernema hermaphroditum]